jgi:hypothetical protein
MKTQTTSSKQVKLGLAAYWALLVLLQGALAGVPFNNLQGAGGVAFNPLAYPAGQNAAEGDDSPISKPQFGAWYVNLGDVDVDWTTFGAAVTAFKRLELSYGYELIAPAGENVKKSNVGAKLNLIPENWGGKELRPGGFGRCDLEKHVRSGGRHGRQRVRLLRGGDQAGRANCRGRCWCRRAC